MRVLLVGRPAERARVRAALDDAVQIVGEFTTLAAARAAGIEAEATILAGDRRARHGDASGDVFRRPEQTPGSGSDSRDTGPEPSGRGSFDEPLTPREVHVVSLLAEGLSNKAIAARLGISDQTVKAHVASLSGKLGAANRTDAVRRAVRRGLITL